MIPLWKGKNPIYFGFITIIPFDNLNRLAYFVMHTFLVLWPLYFQSFLFLLAIVFLVLPFSLGHCIFSPSFFSWALYFQSFLFLLAIVFSSFPFLLGIVLSVFLRIMTADYTLGVFKLVVINQFIISMGSLHIQETKSLFKVKLAR